MNPAVWSLLALPMLHNFEFPAAPKHAYVYFCCFFQFRVSTRVVLEPMQMVFLQHEMEDQCLELLSMSRRHFESPYLAGMVLRNYFI